MDFLVDLDRMRLLQSHTQRYAWEGGKSFTSRRFAVGLVGVAPRLVPSRGQAALIPDASGLYFVPGLRALRLPIRAFVEGGLGGLAVSLYRTTACSPSRAARLWRLRPVAVCDP